MTDTTKTVCFECVSQQVLLGSHVNACMQGDPLNEQNKKKGRGYSWRGARCNPLVTTACIQGPQLRASRAHLTFVDRFLFLPAFWLLTWGHLYGCFEVIGIAGDSCDLNSTVVQFVSLGFKTLLAGG